MNMLTEIVTSHGNANDLFALGVNSRVSPTDRSSAATQRSRHRDRRCTDCRHACERRRRLGDRHCNARRRRLSLPVMDRNVTTICPVYGQSLKISGSRSATAQPTKSRRLDSPWIQTKLWTSISHDKPPADGSIEQQPHPVCHLRSVNNVPEKHTGAGHKS